MPIKVIDASALAAILFDEPGAEEISHELLDSDLLAPDLLGYEIANVCLNKMRRNKPLQKSILKQFRNWRLMGVRLYRIAEIELLPLALETGLTIYDAAYLHLATQYSATLVSLDRELQRAFARIQSSS
ncbi:MAG: type II toxin-antitoxin system VapC family toxin [Spirochaetales bacterium]|nr:type II toxin-antitoxin system VapC family toxin [Spirochaetales bacterium]